jgi:hypothetical protein
MTLRKRQQIVIPFIVGICPDVFAVLSVNNSNVRPFPLNKSIERVRPVFNGDDNLCSRPFPASSRITKMRYPFMPAVYVSFINASYLNVDQMEFSYRATVL